MTKFVIASDNIDGKETSYINRMIKFLKDNGHEAVSAGVGPNKIQSKMQGSSVKGCTGVQIVGGMGLGTITDCMTGIKNGYYHANYFMSVGSYEFTHNSLLKTSMMDTKVNRCEPGMSSSQCNLYRGMTPRQWNEKYGKYTKVIYRDTFEECLKEMIGGQTKENKKDSGSSASSYIDTIKELVSVWDGDVELKTENENFYVNYIKDPTPTIIVKEGVNIVSNSVSVTDYNPKTPNVLNVTYGKNTITMRDNYLINRFGENSVTIPAVEYVTDYSSKNDSKTSDEDMVSTDTTTTEQVSSTSTVSTVPIVDKTKAYEFARKCWNKIKRSNGHTIECQIFGFNTIKQGSWVQVYIPSFSEDCIMYCTKVNHTKDSASEWLANVTLVDYPPSLSTVNIQDKSKDKKEESSTEDSDSEGTEEMV